MALQIRRGQSSAQAGIVPAEGELIYAIDTKQVFIGDGSTAGGIPVGKPIVAGTGISYNSGTGTISTTITQYTDALARAAHSFVAGSGGYNSSTGVITIPTNTSHLTNGAGFITTSALTGYATETFVNTAVSGLVASAPAALDTLNELAAALGNDANYSTTISTALGNRLRVDVNTQALTSTQKSNAATNLGLATVATSGSYTDLTNKPTIPTNTNQLTNGSAFITLTNLSAGTGITYNNTTGVISSSITQYTDALARAAHSFVAGSGGYNSSTGVITIPTNTSHLTNGAGFITASDSSITGKQATLVSGTNIKTINGTSLLGSGDITISGGGGGASTGNIVFNGTTMDATMPTAFGTSNWQQAYWASNNSIYVWTYNSALQSLLTNASGLITINGYTFTISSSNFTGTGGYIYIVGTSGGLSGNVTSLSLYTNEITVTGSLRITKDLYGGTSTFPTKLFSGEVAIGANAGQGQAGMTIAIGDSAGSSGQSTFATAVGWMAGYLNQATGAVAIGATAGEMNQGQYAIAIGMNAGTSGQPANSIILNASGSSLNPTQAGLHVAPVRSDGTPTKILYYNTTTKEITYGDVPVSSGSSGSSGGTFTDSGPTQLFYTQAGPIYVELTFSSPSKVTEFLANVGTNTVTVSGISGPGLSGSATITPAEGTWQQSGSAKARLTYPLVTPWPMTDYMYSAGSISYTYAGSGGSSGGSPAGYFFTTQSPTAPSISGMSYTITGPANAGRIFMPHPYVPGQGGQDVIQNISSSPSPFEHLINKGPAGSPAPSGTVYPWMSYQSIPANTTINVNFTQFISGYPLYAQGFVLDSSSTSAQEIVLGQTSGYAPSGTLNFTNYIMMNSYSWSSPGWIYGMAYPQGPGDWSSFTPATGVTAYWDANAMMLFFRAPASTWSTSGNITLGSVSGYSGSFGVSAYYFGS